MTADWQTTLAVVLAAYAFAVLYLCAPSMRAEWRARSAKRELNESIVARRLK